MISKVTEGDAGLIILDKPMILQISSVLDGEFTLMPWMRASKNLAKSEKITITTETILIEDDPVEEVVREYLAQLTGLTL